MISAQRRRIVKKAQARPFVRPPERHDAHDSAEDRLLRALRVEARKRPEWVILTLAAAGLLSPDLKASAERLMRMIDSLEPRCGGTLGDAGRTVFDPGDAEKVFAGLDALGPAHRARIRQGLTARRIAALKSRVAQKLDAQRTDLFFHAFAPIRPSMAELRAVSGLSFRVVADIIETGMLKVYDRLEA